MNKERLSFFSIEELIAIAQKIGLEVDSENIEPDKDALIEDIIEVFEEDNIERQMETNLAMLIKQKKFQIFLGGTDFLVDQDDAEDPYSPLVQCDTQIHLMLRDPHWGFVYWKFSKNDQFNLKTKKQNLMLRVFQFEDYKEFNPNTLSDNLDYFDIEISLADTKWYINLPCTGCSYAVQILSLSGLEKTVLASSNTITSPKINFNLEFKENIDEMIVATGLYIPTVEEKIVNRTSHRILTDDELSFQNKESFK